MQSVKPMRHNNPGDKYFLFEDLLHSLVRNLFLHLKEGTVHLQ